MADGKKTQKGKKMTIQELNASAEFGSWADDIPDLPTAPSGDAGQGGARRGFGDDYKGSGPGGYRDRGERDQRGGDGGDNFFRDRGERPPRQAMPSDASEWRTAPKTSGPSVFENRRQQPSATFELRSPRMSALPAPSPPQRSGPKTFPNRPPYTAYVGNLDYNCTEQGLVEFFEGLAIKNVRLPADPDGRLKGFAYVEFETLEALQNSMNADGYDFMGRRLKIDLADAPRGEMGWSPTAVDNVPTSDWRSKARPVSGPAPQSSEPKGVPPPSQPRAASPEKIEREVPKERPRLTLKPRSESAPATDGTPVTPESSDAYQRSTKLNPFGAARAIDTLEAERRIEERRKQRDEEVRKQKEAEEVAKKEAEEANKKEVETAKKVAEEKRKAEEKAAKHNEKESEGPTGADLKAAAEAEAEAQTMDDLVKATASEAERKRKDDLVAFTAAESGVGSKTPPVYEYDPVSIFIRGIPEGLPLYALAQLFAEFGSVVNSQINIEKGTGIVIFSDKEAVGKIIGQTFTIYSPSGQPVEVKPEARRKPPPYTRGGKGRGDYSISSTRESESSWRRPATAESTDSYRGGRGRGGDRGSRGRAGRGAPNGVGSFTSAGRSAGKVNGEATAPIVELPAEVITGNPFDVLGEAE